MVPSFDIEGILYMLSRSLQVICPMLKYLYDEVHVQAGHYTAAWDEAPVNIVYIPPLIL